MLKTKPVVITMFYWFLTFHFSDKCYLVTNLHLAIATPVPGLQIPMRSGWPAQSP